MNAQAFFDAARAWKRELTGEGLSQADVDALNAASVGRWEAKAPATSGGRRTGEKGVKLMHSFESCKLTAYPDPGSRDGHPWTIGWGATGPGIARGVTWTQAQADERFKQDLKRFEDGVNRLLGNASTTQDQFDALVSLAYNIGLDEDADTIAEGLGDSSLLRKHKAGDYAGAAEAFKSWVFNDGKRMRGLERRRAAEAALYRGELS